jgi:trypsin
MRNLNKFFPSGGPLTCNGVLFGITSNGMGCAVENYPGIYMDVAHYRDWIATGDSSTNNAKFLIILVATMLSVFL